MGIITVLSWVGTGLLALCGVPQAFKSWREGHSKGISWGLLLMWFFGEIFTCIYALTLGALPLIVNYVVNIAAVWVILHYKIWPRKDVNKPISYTY